MGVRRCDLAGIDPINPDRFRHTWAHAFRVEGGSEGDLMYLAWFRRRGRQRPSGATWP
jgi:hypothetical protein